MVKIRLSRVGTKNQPKFRIIAVDSHEKRDGRFIENLGAFNPTVKPKEVSINLDRYQYWLSVGAQPTKIIQSLVRNYKTA